MRAAIATVALSGALLAACGAETIAPAGPTPGTSVPSVSTVVPAPTGEEAKPPTVPEDAAQAESLTPKLESPSPSPDTLTMGEIETVIDAAKAKHKACFEQFRDKYPGMPSIVRLRLSTAEGGNVKDARILEPAAGEARLPPEAAQCHLAVARALTFRKTATPVTLTYPVRVAGAKPAPAPASPPPSHAPSAHEDTEEPHIERPGGVSADSPTAEGTTLEPNQILAVFTALRPKLRSCYNRALQRNPALVVKFRLRIVIAPSGKVQSAVFVEPSPPAAPKDDPVLRQCIVSNVKTLLFPASARGATVTWPQSYHPASH